MASREAPDPVRATLIAILQQLNRAESINEGQSREQSLELDDLSRLLAKFWAVDQDLVKIPLVLGLLVRNGMAEAVNGGGFGSAPRPRAGGRARYRITPSGKQFLVEAQEKSDRIA